jgi:hypothetical protein
VGKRFYNKYKDKNLYKPNVIVFKKPGRKLKEITKEGKKMRQTLKGYLKMKVLPFPLHLYLVPAFFIPFGGTPAKIYKFLFTISHSRKWKK